jgi:tetratricopeptide (TPR) repeat protein
MSTMLAVLFVVAAAGAGPNVTGAAGDTPLVTREEPHLAAGRRALTAGDVDTAIERFRQAVTTTDTERAVVEYDVGQALMMRALAEAKAAQPPDAQAPGAATPSTTPPAPPTPPNVDDAVAALERAATLARDPRLVSEAQLAAGNAALVGGKLDDAIAHLRRALVADPQNERARRNLQRALTMRQQQPPPPPKDGNDGDKSDGDKSDGDKSDGDKSDGDKSDGDKSDGDKSDGEKSDGDKSDGDGEKSDGDKSDGKKSNGDKSDGKKSNGDKSDGDKSDGDTSTAPTADDPAKDGKAPTAGPSPPPAPSSKQEARRLLQGLRSRERPLSPLQMRGAKDASPSQKPAKDW